MRIFTFGDSHAIFSYVGVRNAQLVWRGPVTMHRAARDGLTSLLPPQVKLKHDDLLILSFGEIDARVHIPKQATRNGTSLIEEADALCRRFQAALDVFSHQVPCHIALSSLVPATRNPHIVIHSHTTEDEYNRDQPIIRDRMNANLQAMPFPFIDLHSPLTDADGLMRVGMDDCNCHLGRAGAMLAVEAINQSLGHAVATFAPPPEDVFVLQWPSTAVTRFQRRFRRRFKAIRNRIMPQFAARISHQEGEPP
jgi:hypothetical protein